MGYSNVRNDFLEMLKDEKIRKEVRKIVMEEDEDMLEFFKKLFTRFFGKKEEQKKEEYSSFSGEIQRYKEEVQRFKYLLEQEKEKLDEEREKLKKEQRNLEEEKSKRERIELELKESVASNSEYQRLLKDEERKVEKLKDRFSEAQKMYELYHGMGERLRKEFGTIFKNDTLDDFIYCGVQGRNIDLLWEIGKKAIMEENQEYHKAVELFNYFFGAFNRTYDTPLYSLMDVEEDEKFNVDRHISKGAAAGDVKKVLLKGYCERNGKVAKKSVVYL